MLPKICYSINIFTSAMYNLISLFSFANLLAGNINDWIFLLAQNFSFYRDSTVAPPFWHLIHLQIRALHNVLLSW